MKKGFKCVICEKWVQGWGKHNHLGNDPYPLFNSGECCDSCNSIVINARLQAMKK